MKAIVFTVDAIFALIIAMASISILLYFHYFSQTPYQIRYGEASSIASQLANTTIFQLYNSSFIAQEIARQSMANASTWPQQFGNPYGAAVGSYGPIAPFVSYVFNASAPITTGIVAGYGNIYFAAGTPSGGILYALNASSNATRWEKATSEIVSTPVIYNNMLIYINQTNMTAVSPINGALIWTTNVITSGMPFSSIRVTTPLLAYDNKIIFGASSDLVYAFYANNGVEAWSIPLGSGEQPQFIVESNGNLVVKSTSGQLTYIILQTNGPAILWNKPSLGVSSTIASEQDLLFFGDGAAINVTYTNGTALPNFPMSTSGVVYAAVPYGSTAYFQVASGLLGVSTSGSVVLNVVAPSQAGQAVSGSSSLIFSNGYLYSLWQHGLLILNVSSGAASFLRIPYSPIGNMSMAYGHVYIAAGPKVIAIGSCAVKASDSLLEASAKLFANGMGSCADSLLNSISTTSDYDVFLNTSFGPSIAVAKFNGNNAYAIAQNQPWLNNTRVSVSLWINISAYPSSGARIISYGDNDTITGHYTGWFIFLNASGLISFSIMNGTGQSKVPLPSSPVKLSTNTWYNIIGVYDGAYLKLYINGKLVSSKKISTSILPPPPSVNLTIGRGLIGDNRFFNGYISNVQIYSLPLGTDAVADIYNNGMQSAPLHGYGLVAWYPLQGDANDYSKYSNPAFTYYVTYTNGHYLPASYANAYEIDKVGSIMPIVNYTTGNVISQNVGVFVWS